MTSKQLKTVLVVSEALTRGGLETRLLTQGRALVARGHRVIYATASDTVAAPLAAIASATYAGLPMGAGVSARTSAEAAERLADIIRDEKVDVVHAHPFTTLTVGAMGAALAGVPLTVTAHGPSSFATSSNLENTLYDFVLPFAASIRVVSHELTGLILIAFSSRMHVLPNTVDLEHFTFSSSLPKKGPWAFVGRLADGKSLALETLVRAGAQLGIDEVHVIGSGTDEAAVRAQFEGAPVKVEFIGWRDDISELLREGYAGVVGMGRVVLEAAALGLPCILAGYGQLHGAVTAERFKAFAFTNFSGRGMPAVDIDTLRAQLSALDDAGLSAVRRLVEAEHDEARLVHTNEELLGAAVVDEEARTRMLQLFAAFRRAEPGDVPWQLDYALTMRLRQLTRRPGMPFVQNTLADVNALVEAHANRVASEQNKQLEALTKSVAQLQQQLTALNERLGAVSAQPLRHALKSLLRK